MSADNDSDRRPFTEIVPIDFGSVEPKMEAAGIEPASRDVSATASTCMFGYLSFAGKVPNRQGARRAIRQRCLAAHVADVTGGESDLAAGFWVSPTKPRSRDCLS